MALNKQEIEIGKVLVGTRKLCTWEGLNEILSSQFQSTIEGVPAKAVLAAVAEHLGIENFLVKPRCPHFFIGTARYTVFNSKNPVRPGWNVGMRTYIGTFPVFILHVDNDGWAVWIAQRTIALQ